jgi:hypothetical protein
MFFFKNKVGTKLKLFSPMVERKNGLHFIQRLYALQNGSNHGLSAKNLKKLKIRSKIMELILLKIFHWGLLFATVLAYGSFLIIAYIRQDYNIYFITIIIWWSISVYITERIQLINLTTVFIGYLITYYLKLSFQQITEQFEKISAKNLNHLISLIRSHDRISKLTNNCNLFYSKVMALVYFYGSVMINLALLLLLYGNPALLVKLAAQIQVFIVTTSLYLVTYTAHRCYGTINSINARNKIPVLIKLKVISKIKYPFLA